MKKAIHKSQYNNFDSHFIYEANKNLIDEYLRSKVSMKFLDKRRIVLEAMQYCLFGKSKRARPQLTLLVHQLFTNKSIKILPLAGAIEMFHTFSLIHDDLPALDNDPMRRGQSSCHIKFGEDVAILTGDMLHVLAFDLISSDLIHHYDSQKILKVYQLFLQSIGLNGVLGGEIIDIKDKCINLNQLREMHYLKTGSLLQLACVVPAFLENANEIEMSHIEKFSGHLGVLFQIVDDILDATGTIETLGKTPGKDFIEGKSTYVTLLGLSIAKEMAQNEYQAAKDS